MKFKNIIFFVFPLFFATTQVFSNFDNMSLNDYLQQHNCRIIEGHCCTKNTTQPQCLIDIINENPQVRTIGEIGFNAGHSSDLFLKANENVLVYSFDIMTHNYAPIGKEYIDRKYPNRHILIPGNSLQTVPQFSKNNQDIVFDVIFIDGGHLTHITYNDIKNMKKLSHKNTIVVVDDLNYGPVIDGWMKCLKEGIITTGTIHQSNSKVWSVCNYIFND